MGHPFIIACLVALLGAAGYALYVGWNLGEGAEMSGHGWAAMTLGIVFSLVVGCGLMALLFFSHRRGYDGPEEEGDEPKK